MSNLPKFHTPDGLLMSVHLNVRNVSANFIYTRKTKNASGLHNGAPTSSGYFCSSLMKYWELTSVLQDTVLGVCGLSVAQEWWDCNNLSVMRGV